MTWLIISALTVVVLLAVLTVATARQPGTGVPSMQEYGPIWQQQHRAPDVNPYAGLVGTFLRFSYRMAAPLARRGVQPDVLTLWGLALAAAVPATASVHHRWPLLASALVIISALTDGVDGCVAGLTGRATMRGFVLDSVVDRVSDALFAGALVVAGGAAWAAVTAVGALMMMEYLRARSGNAGMGEVGVVTVGERPSRIIAAVLGLGAIGISPAHASFIATGSLLVMAGVAAVGFVQLAVHIGRR